MIKKFYLPLYFILLLAFTLRLWNLQGLPVGFASDEVMNGYVGRYILENGFDLYGNRWPVLYFDHFGDYPNVIPMYLSGLFTYLFGINEFAVRFPIALAGSLTVLLVYLIGKWLWRSEIPALMAAFVLTVMPWHIILSRATAEGITASFVFLAGVFIVLTGMEKNNRKKILLGWLLTFFTYLLYPGFRVFVPLAFFPAVFLATKTQKKLMMLLITTLFASTFLISQTVWGKGRFDQTSIFSYNNLITGKAVNYSLAIGDGKVLQARIFSNKIILAAREFLRQYATYFSPAFLTGENTNPPRYFVPEHGVIYWSFLLLIIVAFVSQFIFSEQKMNYHILFRNRREKYFLWIMWLLLVAPIPASLTLEDVPNIHRTVIMAPLLAISLGFATSLIRKVYFVGRKAQMLVFILLVVAETLYFSHYYANLHSVVATTYRNDKQRSLASWFIDHSSEFSTIYAPSGEGLQIHYLFQTSNFSSIYAGQFQRGLKIERIDNIVFMESDCPSHESWAATSSATVFVDKSECIINDNFLELTRIQRLDDLDAYRILVPNKTTN